MVGYKVCARECRCPRTPEMELDSPELEFQTVVSKPWKEATSGLLQEQDELVTAEPFL